MFAEIALASAIVVVAATLLVSIARLTVEMLTNGRFSIREVRSEGGGLPQKMRGELKDGQRKASTSRAHGLHISAKHGAFRLEGKSVIANDAG